MVFDQSAWDIRCEWGAQGIRQLANISDVIIIVDVLSFSTAVDIATQRGAIVYPYRSRDQTIDHFAQSVGAIVAETRGSDRYSLSPTSLLMIEPGTRLVLPSPNGATLSVLTGNTPTLAGCLRNCASVAWAATCYGTSIAVIPAGERWTDGSLRPAFEDMVGAGAIIHHLPGRLSPEAQAAMSVYQGVTLSLRSHIQDCGSGQELIRKGFESDVDLAASVDVSDSIPLLTNGAYVNRKP
jgi:2-phosphosulfolactate phosphatase